ncbi:hypothetical protein FRC0355_02171 [Corynebacterium diphtheriae]|nr:hypothetical protein FRC0355_02171 [Corynebacterium diphtheriae]
MRCWGVLHIHLVAQSQVCTVLPANAPVNRLFRFYNALISSLGFGRGIALGFHNLDHYILRCLIHAANIRHKINAL